MWAGCRLVPRRAVLRAVSSCVPTEVQGMSRLSRRDLLRLSAAGVVGYSFSGWLKALAADTAGDRQRRRSCILLWMNGGARHTGTFGLQPGHAHPGPVPPVGTPAPAPATQQQP